MANWYNAHNDGHLNTGTYEYEQSIRDQERRARERQAADNLEYENWGLDRVEE